MRTINVGLIGHKYMGRAHTHGYTDMPLFTDIDVRVVKKVLCANEDSVEGVAMRWGWESWTLDWREVVNNPEIDMIDIAAPSILHSDIAIAAAKAGKHVMCEKPMAMNLKDAHRMLCAAEQAKIVNMIGFNYRCVPAVVLAKQMIADGKIGEIYHFRGVYQQDWLSDPEYPITWRLKKELAGSGTHGDMGSHVVDVMRYWLGEVKEVVCDQRTYYRQRPIARYSHGIEAEVSAEKGEVDVDDASMMIVRFRDNNGMGYVEATRNGTGHKNQNRIEVSGSKGALIFDMENLNVLQYFNVDDPAGLKGFRTIQVSEAMHPHMGNWWAPGHIIGYGDTFIHQARNFAEAILKGVPASPSFEDGYRCQLVLEAAQISHDERRWVQMSEVKP